MTPIDAATPSGWKDFEAAALRILRECGLEAEGNKTLPLVRGSVAVDIFASDRSSTPPSTLVVECKAWARRVPKQVVHGLRTVVVDAGVHRGLLVSRRGFQLGAIEAAARSNVEFLDWAGFQELFAERCHERFFVPSMREARVLGSKPSRLTTVSRTMTASATLRGCGGRPIVATRESNGV